MVGVMDATTNTYSEVSGVTGGTTATSNFFNGAVAIGTKAYFAPYVRTPPCRSPSTHSRTAERTPCRTGLHWVGDGNVMVRPRARAGPVVAVCEGSGGAADVVRAASEGCGLMRV